MHDILNILCKYYEIPSKQIFADTRKEKSIIYRHLFFYLCKSTISKVKYWQIIDFAFNQNLSVKQNHSTLINGIRKTEDRLSYDKQFQQDVKNLKEIIRNQKEPAIVVKFVDLVGMCGKNF